MNGALSVAYDLIPIPPIDNVTKCGDFNFTDYSGEDAEYSFSENAAAADIENNVDYARKSGVEIKTYPINSSNRYAAYRLDINNFQNIPLKKEYQLFEILPKDETLASR